MVLIETIIHITFLIQYLIQFHGLSETIFYRHYDTCLCSKNAPHTAYTNSTKITDIEITPNDNDPDIF